MVYISKSITVEEAATETELISIPEEYVGYLVRLELTNKSTTGPATVQIVFYNGNAGKPVLNLSVAENATLTLAEDELPQEGAPTKIAVTADNVPCIIDCTVDLR